MLKKTHWLRNTDILSFILPVWDTKHCQNITIACGGIVSFNFISSFLNDLYLNHRSISAVNEYNNHNYKYNITMSRPVSGSGITYFPYFSAVTMAIKKANKTCREDIITHTFER